MMKPRCKGRKPEATFRAGRCLPTLNTADRPRVSLGMKSLLFVLLLSPALLLAAENRDAKVVSDRTKVVAIGGWIYNDLPKAFGEAQRTGKPLLVVFRCIP